jgi:hypothetical protein
MPVPTSKANFLKNTTGGAYSSTRQGGTILGNTTTSTERITKALALKDNATEYTDGTLPRVKNNGLSHNRKPYSSGTFAYSEAGKYVIAASSATLSGAANTNILITGRGDNTRSIAQFEHDFGATTTSFIRSNRFARSGYLNNGTKLQSRRLFLNAAGTASAKPTALNTFSSGYMWSPVNDNKARHIDNAANPTRAVPGELVMKVDFVTLSVASGGDFFNYKAITGM